MERDCGGRTRRGRSECQVHPHRRIRVGDARGRWVSAIGDGAVTNPVVLAAEVVTAEYRPGQWLKWWIPGVLIVIVGVASNSTVVVWLGCSVCVAAAALHIGRLFALWRRRQ